MPDLLVFIRSAVADSDADLACHHGGDEGTTVLAEAPAGAKVTFNWAYVSSYRFCPG
jgi:hypothetical protein